MNTQSSLDNPSAGPTSHVLLFIPTFCAIMSAVALVIHKCSSGLHLRGVTLNRSVQNANATPRIYSSGFPVVISQRSRPDPSSRAKMWKLVRLAACFTLVMISIAAISLAGICQKSPSSSDIDTDVPGSGWVTKYGFGNGRWGGRKHKKPRHSGDFCLSQQQKEQLSISVFYVYAAVLALLTVALEHKFRKICNMHLTILLLIALAIDSWVVVLPTVPFWGSPPDYTALDWVVLGRTAVLAFAAVIVPIYVQRAYMFRDREAKSLRSNRSATGRLVAKNLLARNSPGAPARLKRINFMINPGERVCVIGDDESGRRELALALLRTIPTSGMVYLDGISTHTIATEALSSHVTFITEQPTLPTGTVRQLLNPQRLYGDVTLYSTLRSLGLEINLDAIVDELTDEQQARILLAKALVCRSKLVILDEMNEERTSAIRFTIQTRLPQSTLVLLTNRVQSARDVEQVMMLDKGRVVEYGPPGTLLRKWSGPFKGLVDASKERKEFYKIFCK